MVPVNKQSHLRPLATINQVNKCISILKSKPKIKRSMWSRRAQEYEAKISSGKIYELAEVVRRAVAISDIEMQVLHGRRSLKQQDEFFKKGATEGITSPHLYGYAVDLVAIVEGRMCFETEVYDEVANCMKYAGQDLNTASSGASTDTIQNTAQSTTSTVATINIFGDQLRGILNPRYTK